MSDSNWRGVPSAPLPPKPRPEGRPATPRQPVRTRFVRPTDYPDTPPDDADDVELTEDLEVTTDAPVAAVGTWIGPARVLLGLFGVLELLTSAALAVFLLWGVVTAQATAGAVIVLGLISALGVALGLAALWSQHRLGQHDKTGWMVAVALAGLLTLSMTCGIVLGVPLLVMLLHGDTRKAVGI